MSARARKLVLFTSQEIGFSLVHILAREHLSLLVIVDRTIRNQIYGYRCAIDACEKLGIPYVKSSRISNEVSTRVREFEPDILLCAYFPHIIPDEIIKLPRLGAVNIHPGLLPRYRGKFPTPWYILNGEEYFGVAIHRIDSGVDTGDILIQGRYPLSPSITGHELYRLTMTEAASLLSQNLEAILSGSVVAKRQEGVGSYFSSIERRYHIDWNLSATYIERRIRVHAKPYLPAFSYLFNRVVFINRARRVTVDGFTAQGGGYILDLHLERQFVVSCSDGCLLVEEFDVFPPLSSDDLATHLRVGNRLE